MNTYAVFNVTEKDFFKFEKYEDAYCAYLSILRDCIKESHLIPTDWYLLTITNGKIVQFQRFNWDTHSVAPFNQCEVISFTPNW